MCSNYEAVTDMERIASKFGVDPESVRLPPDLPREQYPVRLAPFIRLTEDSRKMLVEAGQFGLLPHFAKEVSYGRKTYNSRSETVSVLPSFKTAWKRGQRCIIPCERIFEPCYETGKPVRWAVESVSGDPLGVAGIWAQHPSLTMPDGKPMLSFAMLTVNAEGHPIFQRMHAPEDEKRMVVILHPGEYDRWLTCGLEEAPTFFQQYIDPLQAYPAPKPARESKPKPPPGQPDPKDAPLL